MFFACLFASKASQVFLKLISTNTQYKVNNELTQAVAHAQSTPIDYLHCLNCSYTYAYIYGLCLQMLLIHNKNIITIYECYRLTHRHKKGGGLGGHGPPIICY